MLWFHWCQGPLTPQGVHAREAQLGAGDDWDTEEAGKQQWTRILGHKCTRVGVEMKGSKKGGQRLDRNTVGDGKKREKAGNEAEGGACGSVTAEQGSPHVAPPLCLACALVLHIGFNTHEKHTA